MVEPKFTVIIPTYNRSDILAGTIASLCEKQTGSLPDWEIIIVDDGSTDNTQRVLTEYRNRYARLSFLTQENKKQGAARNAAMKLAKGELFIFLGDDIIPSPEFLFTHWKRYVQEGRPSNYAAIGRTFWHPEIKETPFRYWINEWGQQFGFRLITTPNNVPFNFFYTSNLSFSRSLYQRYGGFDESFREYGWEDTELGYRYKKNGMELRYEPGAIAYHLHEITLTSFCKRQFKVGYSAVQFHRLHPELSDFLLITKIRPELAYSKHLLWIIAHFFEILDEHTKADFCRIHDRILKTYLQLGMLKAQREFGE
ncbi:MAG: glycosyltransferase [Deltaproteobacteria bacterium]